MRVALRASLIGAGEDAAGARALYAALIRAGVDVFPEARDPGGPVTAHDAPPPEDRGGPVNAHVQWCRADEVDPDVRAPVRVARVHVPDWINRGDVQPLTAMDEVWVDSEPERRRLVSLGLSHGAVRVCREPVVVPSRLPAPPAGVHGDLFVAIDPDPQRLRTLVGVWVQAVPADADATLVITGGEDLTRDVLEVIRAAGQDDADIADLMLICEPMGDADRLGLIAGARTVLTPGRRTTAEAVALGVPVADVATDPPALAALLSHASRDDVRVPGDLRHDPDAVAAMVLSRLAVLGRGRRPVDGFGRPRVVLEGSMYGAHSLAAVNRGLARALMRQGRVDLGLRNSEGAVLDPSGPVHHSIRSLVWGCGRHHGSPHVTIRHGNPADLRPVTSGALVAILPWEFGGAPVEWLRSMRHIDEVWVPTEYVRDGFVEAGAPPQRVVVVPNGIDPAAFNPGASPRDLGPGAPGFRFLFVGGLAWRKGVDLLVSAYRQAFRATDDVTLVLKDFGPQGPYVADGVDRLVDELAGDPRAARVLRLSGPLPESDLPGLYAACDCLVHPYRAEAYGMTMLEAMAVGRPVIAPDHGAAMAFMDDQTALLVEARRVELGTCEIGGQRMLQPPVVHEVDVEALATAMRWAYEHRDQASEVGRRAAGFVAAGHTWDDAARIASSRLWRMADVESLIRRTAA